MSEASSITCPVCRTTLKTKPQVSDSSKPWTPAMVDALAKTSPWVIFLAILGIISGCLACLGAVVYAVVGLNAIREAGPFEGERVLAAAVVLYSTAIAAVTAAVYVVAAAHLRAYGYAISRFVRSKEMHTLEKAMVEQKSFWRLAGIMTVVTICLNMPLLLVFMWRLY
jgi:hypothetical protein